MSWAEGLILWMLFGIGALWVFAEVASRFNQPDEFDHTAERKRKIARKAKLQSGEFR